LGGEITGGEQGRSAGIPDERVGEQKKVKNKTKEGSPKKKDNVLDESSRRKEGHEESGGIFTGPSANLSGKKGQRKQEKDP